MDQAAKSAEQVKQIATKAAETDAISDEDAKEIKNSAENLQKAAIKNADAIEDRINSVFASGSHSQIADIMNNIHIDHLEIPKEIRIKFER